MKSNKNLTRNRIITIASSILFLSSCSPEYDNAKDDGTVLRWSIGAEIQGLDPHIVTGVPENRVLTALCEGLTSYHPGGKEPQPGVASSWEVSPDGLTYTFHFNPKSVWSDGVPLVANDFVFSWERVLTPVLGGQYANMLYPVVGAEKFYNGEISDFSQVGIRAIDDLTLEIKLIKPVPFFLDLLSHYSTFSVPPHVILANGDMTDRANPWAKPGTFVCNGGYTLEEWSMNKKIVVKKNPNYWDASTITIDTIEYFPLTNNKTEYNSFKSGGIHITSTVPLEDLKQLRIIGDPNLRIDPYMGTYFYRLNTTRPPLDKLKIRKALAYAIDRKTLVENVTGGGELAAYSFTPPSEEKGYLPTTTVPFDPDLAQQLLAEAGYPNGEGFPTIELIYNTSEGHRKIALAVQEMWRKHLNINIDIANLDWKVYLHRQRSLDFDVARAGWIGDYPDPLTFLDIMVTDRGNNETGFSDPLFDRLVENDSYYAVGSERMRILKRAEKVLIDAMPIIPIYTYTNKFMISDSVKGYESNLMGNHPPKYLRLESNLNN